MALDCPKSLFQVAFALCTLSETLTIPKAPVLQGVSVYNTQLRHRSQAQLITLQLGLARKGKSHLSFLCLPFSLLSSLFPSTRYISGHQHWCMPSSVAPSFMLLLFQSKLWHKQQHVMKKKIMKGKQKY